MWWSITTLRTNPKSERYNNKNRVKQKGKERKTGKGNKNKRQGQNVEGEDVCTRNNENSKNQSSKIAPNQEAPARWVTTNLAMTGKWSDGNLQFGSATSAANKLSLGMSSTSTGVRRPPSGE